MPEIKVKLMLKDHTLPIPKYETNGAAGVDLASAEEGTLAPGERKLIPTGLFMEIPSGYEGQIRPRSGLAIQHGVTMLNTPGTIDSDYRGEIQVILFNSSLNPFHYKKGDRIAQMVFAKVERAVFEQIATLTETERNARGFGSTGL